MCQQGGEGLHWTTAGQVRTDTTGQQKRSERGEAAQMVCKGELGPATEHAATHRPVVVERNRRGEFPASEGVALAAPGGPAEPPGKRRGPVWRVLECDTAL